MYTICRNDIIYVNSHIYSNNIIKKMGGNDIMGSELIFSDTVHQFLQVLTLSRKQLLFWTGEVLGDPPKG